MVKFTVDKIRELMDVPQNIRNVTVIAHVDHGKSTLTESLVAAAGITAKTDSRLDEQLRGITIKSTAISLFFESPTSANKVENLINIIDSPGHVDFSSEVTAALRLTDGALVLVDCVEGCCVQTETVLRQALRERIKPVLAINKLDRAFLELKMDHEDIYQSFCRSIESVNSIIAYNEDDALGDVTVYPEKGTVAFAAGKQGWGFTLKQFAKLYAKKFNIQEDNLVSKLWGDWYFDHEAKKWIQSPVSPSGQPLKRGFCKFVLEPVSQVFEACLSNDRAQLEKLLKSMNIQLSNEEKERTDKDLLQTVMRKWLPLAEPILDMITVHLPSPLTAQRYRVETLYTGPLDDEVAASIRRCDPKGPLVVFISKMVPMKDSPRFFAFGRVFSGTVATGQKVIIMGPNYQPGVKEDHFVDIPIQRTVVMMGKRPEPIIDVPCGNTVALLGIDNYISKTCTITTSKEAFPLANMRYSVAPVVRVAVAPKSTSDLLKLVDAFKRLNKSDTLIQVTVEPSGEHVISCAGELHLEIVLNELKEYMNGAELVISKPVVNFTETVTAKSSITCIAKSPNGHNRLYVVAEPLPEDLIAFLEQDKLPRDEPKARARILVDSFGWSLTEARNVWSIGGPGSTNMVVDCTRGVQYMNEIKESVVASFAWVTNEGVLAEEKLRGVRFNILDAVLHADAVHRGGGQIIPTARRAFYAAQLTAKPALYEPIYQVEISCSSKTVGGVYSVLSQRRGVIGESTQKNGNLVTVKGFLPVTEAFGFNAHLRSETSGQAFPQCTFDHWKLIVGDALDPTSKVAELVDSIRKRKGLTPEVPPLTRFYDKL